MIIKSMLMTSKLKIDINYKLKYNLMILFCKLDLLQMQITIAIQNKSSNDIPGHGGQ